MTVNHDRGTTVAHPRKTVGQNAPNRAQERLNRPNDPKIRYKRTGTARRMLLEQVRLVAMLAVTGCLLLAIETTPPGVIDLPVLGAAAPSLGLLFCMAVGFLLREEEGAITGLCMGWLADATGAGGMMLSPLLYCLCGYLAGRVGQRRLAHNLPSFVVFAVLGGGMEVVFTVLREAIIIKGIPPFAWILRSTVPVWLLTIAASPIVYGILYVERRILREKE